MKEKNHFNGRTMHIDVSRRFYQKGDSGMAFKIIPSKYHKGLALSNKLKNELRKDFLCFLRSLLLKSFKHLYLQKSSNLYLHNFLRTLLTLVSSSISSLKVSPDFETKSFASLQDNTKLKLLLLNKIFYF